MIIGLSGTSLVGREAVASHLIEKGFGYYSFNNELDRELEEKGLNSSQTHRDRQAALLREHGRWLRRIMSEMTEQNVIIDGIKTVADVKMLRERKDFVLIGVYSPVEVRFERAAAKELLTDESKDNDEVGREMEELSKVFSMIDESIVYPAAETTMTKKIDDILRKRKA